MSARAIVPPASPVSISFARLLGLPALSSQGSQALSSVGFEAVYTKDLGGFWITCIVFFALAWVFAFFFWCVGS